MITPEDRQCPKKWAMVCALADIRRYGMSNYLTAEQVLQIFSAGLAQANFILDCPQRLASIPPAAPCWAKLFPRRRRSYSALHTPLPKSKVSSPTDSEGRFYRLRRPTSLWECFPNDHGRDPAIAHDRPSPAFIHGFAARCPSAGRPCLSWLCPARSSFPRLSAG